MLPDSSRSPVRELLFASDFSESASCAARVARDYARHLGARVHALHVTSSSSEVLAVRVHEKLAEPFRPGVPVATVVVAGAPAQQIVLYADRNNIDVIVLGTHGRTGFSRALIGSVAEAVIRNARCPVLAVPVAVRQPDARATIAPGAPLEHCLVCAEVSVDRICGRCRGRIRGHAREREHVGV